MKCPRCEHESPSQAKFCEECATPLARTCTNCGVQLSVTVLGAKASNPSSGKLFIDFILSKEGQEMVKRFRRIPTRTDVDPDPPRLFKGYKRIVDHPDRYKNLNEIASLYEKIFKIR